jgi:hypothetical protein
LNEKSRVFDIIMMKNIFLGISVRDTIFLWKFFEDVAEEEAKVSHVEEIPPTYDTTPPKHHSIYTKSFISTKYIVSMKPIILHFSTSRMTSTCFMMGKYDFLHLISNS